MGAPRHIKRQNCSLPVVARRSERHFLNSLMILLGNDLPGPLPTGQVSGVLDRTFWRLFLVDSARIIDLFCHQGEDGWEDVDDDEAEGIEVSGGSPFAPASEYFGETFII